MYKEKTPPPGETGAREKERHSVGPHSRLLTASLAFRLAAFILILALILSGCSLPFGGGSNQTELKDGVLTNGDLTLDFGDNRIDDDSGTTLDVLTPDEDDAPEGLASDLYELNMEDVYDEPVTVTLKFDEECPVDDDEAQVMLGVGTTFEMEEGGTETLYSYIPVEESGGNVTASFTPADYAELFVRGSSNTGSSAPHMERTHFALFWISTTYIDGGHFIVYMPLKAHTFFLDYNERRALLDDLEETYNDYLGKNYSYSKRSSWPMKVTIKALDAQGYYSYGYSGADGSIYINRSLFEKGYKAGALSALMAHEFFHFVQHNYVDVGKDLEWFDEATATYFEGAKGGTYPNIVGQYKELIFSGVYPKDNTRANGYARMPLIQFLVKTLGEESILFAYQNAGQGFDWDMALESVAGPPSDWAGDFYEALVKGDVGDFTPLAIHKELVVGKSGAVGIGTALPLVMPESDEIAQLQEAGEPVLLGKTTLSVAAYGAQLAAVTIDADNLNKLPDGTDPIIKVGGGGDLRAFAILGSKVQTVSDTGSGITLNDFKKATGSKYVFLALITNPSDSAQDFELSVEIEPFPTLDELVGTYDDGMATYTEVFISDSLRAQLANPGAAQENLEVEEELGCDINLDVIGALERMVGQSTPMQIIIEKTGENTGTLRIVSEDSSSMDDSPIPFTYEKGKLILSLSQSYSIEGSIAASYGKNRDVVIDGVLTLTLAPENLWMKVQITGTKPLQSP